MNEFERGAGILLPISSLPSEYGIGTLGQEAIRFIDLLIDLRQHYWQVLPLSPTTIGDSPYQAFSAMAGSPYYIDLDLLVKDGLLLEEEIQSFQWENKDFKVDYGNLFIKRTKVLRMAFKRFDLEDGEFQKFLKQKKWLGDYALFMALKENFGHVEWLKWDADIRNREEHAVAYYEKLLSETISFYKFVQFEFFKQWNKVHRYARSKGIEIIGDIPLYVSLDSVDVWVHREEFQLGEDGYPSHVAGCPPDAFTDDGQKWGNPLYNYEVMEKNGFKWWKERMAANASMYDIIRIDHFLAVVKYFSIPAEDETARNGKWEKGPGKNLCDAITSVMGESKIIVEDLGVYVKGVKKLAQKMKWPCMKVLLFGFDGNTSHEYLPHNYTEHNIVVYGGTHDNETLMGYFKDKSEYELAFLYEYLNIKNKREIPEGMIRLAYSSIANVVIFQMQDLLGLGNEARMNFPGTVGLNWSWRFKFEDLEEKRRDFIRTMATIYRR